MKDLWGRESDPKGRQRKTHGAFEAQGITSAREDLCRRDRREGRTGKKTNNHETEFGNSGLHGRGSSKKDSPICGERKDGKSEKNKPKAGRRPKCHGHNLLRVRGRDPCKKKRVREREREGKMSRNRKAVEFSIILQTKKGVYEKKR